ncbi:MAG: hypothetical protein PUH88_10075 [Lachnospiraceae bacterium]|nr:hypothetical protein [Lachnospiraceae bacterium]
MKKLRLFSTVILICSAVLFGYCIVRQWKNDEKVPPVIKMDQTSIEVSVKDGDDALLKGVTATDKKDGDVTDSLIVDNISDFLDDGSRFVTIAAIDSNNNVAKAVRQITYSDYEHPKFDFTESMRFVEGETDYLDNVTAEDSIDGDLSGTVNFSDNTQITVDKAGTYKAELQVRNSLGDTEYLPFTLEVLKAEDYNKEPSIHLKHFVKYIKKGKTIDYKNNLDYVYIGSRKYKLVDGDKIENTTVGRDRIHVNDDNVKYNTPGVYEVEYSMTLNDEMKEDQETIRGTVRLVVVVEE